MNNTGIGIVIAFGILALIMAILGIFERIEIRKEEERRLAELNRKARHRLIQAAARKERNGVV